MKKAFQASSSQYFSVEKYVDNFGPKLDQFASKRVRPDVICNACKQVMHTVGEDGPLRDATWAHNPSRQAPWCPLKESAGAKYEILSPSEPDELSGVVLRKSFFVNWLLHWSHIIEMVPMCDIYTFIKFIQYADRKNLWQQRGLEEWFLPYIFLATCDFPPPKSKTGKNWRQEWIRCRFDSRVRTADDLWIRTDGDWGYIKAEYILPINVKQPNPKHLISVKQITPDKNFLKRVSRFGNTFQINAMKEQFPVDIQ